MTRQEAEDYIYASYMRALPHLRYDEPDSRKRHPEYTAGIIGSLYKGTPSIAVTGSKGKGSVAYILSVILEHYGRTGLMTGPHVSDFNERFRAGLRQISDEELADITEQVRPLFDRVDVSTDKGGFISPIGIETAIAEIFFSSSGTKYDIYECGKGVKYDDVRNIPADYAVINTIFLEHTRELGSSLSEIAEDKACIIREGMKCVYSGKQEDVVEIILAEQAEKKGVALKRYGRDFEAYDISFAPEGMRCGVRTKKRRYEDLYIPLMGAHQCRNLALAVAAAEDMAGEAFCGTEDDIRALRKALSGLFWYGRLSVIRKDPILMVDCCINRVSAAAALETVCELGLTDVTFILAVPDDKDYEGVARAVAEKGHRIVLTKVANPHYRFEGIQLERLKEAGLSCEYVPDLKTAINGTSGHVVVLGTTDMLKEIKRMDRRM